jgi:pimeloyl-ACP methyl ester carboxylesterase
VVIAWEEAGAGAPIVFVHGLTENRRGWDDAVTRLADTFRCVRLDLRGHGESSDAEDYSAFAMTQDVAAVVTEASIDEPPLVVGHSLGAMVSTIYAATAPTRGVINVDQPLNVGAFAEALQPIGGLLRGDGFRDAFAAAIAGLGTERIPEPRRAWAEDLHANARQEIVVGVWSEVLDTPPADLQALVESLLPAITVPYLAIHGGDPGPDYAPWLRAMVPGATVEVWDGDAHYPHLVEPERFADRVRAFHAAT